MKILIILSFAISLMASNCVRFSTIPFEEAGAIKGSYQKLKSDIEKKSDICIDFKMASSYGEVIEMLAKKEIDCARLGPFSFVQADDKISMTPIVVGQREDGKTSYKSYIVAQKKIAKKLNINEPLKGEVGIKKLASKLLPYKKKLTIAFTDESSTSGFVVPSYYLNLAKIDKGIFFKRVSFLGTHDSTNLAVETGLTNLAGTNSRSYEKLLKAKKIGKNSVIIWESEYIPGSPTACRSDFDKQQMDKFKFALLSLEQQSIPDYGDIYKYVEIEKPAFNVIRGIQTYMKQNSEKN